MITHEDLQSLVDKFERLPDKINEVSQAAFENVYGSELASKTKKIIYFVLSSEPVPRLNGKSNILYIGQTKNSLKTRYFQYAELEATSKANKLKYDIIIKNYGPMEVAFCDYKKFGHDLLTAEGQFLWWYFQNHGEYPPLNYTKTKIRNDEILCK